MELKIARMIIDTLAEGIHPVTGEAMPEDSPYNAPPVIRALHAVSRALDSADDTRSHSRQRSIQSPNSGNRWSAQEDSALETGCDAGVPIKQLAQELGRTTFAVTQRLIRLGKIERTRGASGVAARC